MAEDDARPEPGSPGAIDGAEGLPPDDATVASPDAVPTDVGPTDVGPTGTSIFPVVPGPATEPNAAAQPTAPQEPAAPPEPPAPKWSARAQVRSPDADRDAPAEWDDSAGQPPRGLFVPVVVGAAVLLLAALVGLIVWLANSSGSTPGTPTPTPTRPPAPTATTKAPTTAPPTTTEPATTVPATVPVPDVKGMSFDAASALLTSSGLHVTQQSENSTDVAAGSVTRTDPAAGQEVPVGSSVTVFVSLGGPTAEPTTPVPPAS